MNDNSDLFRLKMMLDEEKHTRSKYIFGLVGKIGVIFCIIVFLSSEVFLDLKRSADYYSSHPEAKTFYEAIENGDIVAVGPAADSVKNATQKKESAISMFYTLQNGCIIGFVVVLILAGRDVYKIVIVTRSIKSIQEKQNRLTDRNSC